MGSVNCLRAACHTGHVDKQQAVFFLLRVSTEVAQSGLALRCFSANKSRFKLVVFDKKGSVRYLVSAPTYSCKFNCLHYGMHSVCNGINALTAVVLPMCCNCEGHSCFSNTACCPHCVIDLKAVKLEI